MYGKARGARRRLAFLLPLLILIAFVSSGSPGPSSRVHEVAATTTPATPNPVVSENAKPGTSNWRIGENADDVAKQIKGYASAVSVNLGQALTMFVTVNPAQKFDIDIYRTGYYQGLGGRLVQHVGGLNGTQQPDC